MLIIHGDTVSTRRLYEAFLYSSIPVIFSNQIMQFGLPFLQIVPWKDIAFFVNTEMPIKNIRKELISIKNAPMAIIKLKFEALQTYRDDVLWNSKQSRVFENILQ